VIGVWFGDLRARSVGFHTGSGELTFVPPGAQGL
jgi:hypothetical protein